MDERFEDIVKAEFLILTETDPGSLSVLEETILKTAIQVAVVVQKDIMNDPNKELDANTVNTLKHLQNSVNSIQAIKSFNNYNAMLDTIGRVLAKTIISAL